MTRGNERFKLVRAGTDWLILDRSNCHRPIRVFRSDGGGERAAGKKAEAFCSAANVKNGPWRAA